MELISQNFTKELEKLLKDLNNKACQRKLIATIPVPGRITNSVIESIKNLPQAQLYNVTKSNREEVYNAIRIHVHKLLGK